MYLDSQKILSLLSSKQYVAIVPHRSPDGDAIGSAVALKKAVQQFHSNVDIVCIDPAPKYTQFLLKNDEIKSNLDLNIYKIICFVDCGSKSMSKFDLIHPEIFNNSEILTINIDHHNSNDNYANLNIVDTTCASTTQILLNLFIDWNIKITPEIAEALLTGLHFDTGSFKHPNTCLKVLKAASILTRLGADNKKIAKHLFKTTQTSQLKLWGEVFQKTRVNHRKIASSIITKQDFEKTKTNNKDLEGVIDYLNAIPNNKFSVLINEDFTGGVKGSLRTLDETIDLNALANLFGGGGHKMAAGFRIEGSIAEKTKYEIQ